MFRSHFSVKDFGEVNYFFWGHEIRKTCDEIFLD